MTTPIRYPEQLPDIARGLAERHDAWFWLDGEAAAPGEPRRSYLGAATEIRIAERGREREFLAELRAGADGAARDGEGPRTLDLIDGFSCGWVVALGYEFGVGLLGVDPEPDDAPPAFALRVESVLVVDHACRSAEVRGPTAEWWEGVSRHLRTAEAQNSPGPAAPLRGLDRTDPEGEGDPRGRIDAGSWRHGDAEYLREIAECRASIRAGDAYVLCLTGTLEQRTRLSPLGLYTRLRESGPALRGGVIVAGDRALVSASPERFLGVSAGRVVTHPIKGTRPRGGDPAHDRALRRELSADPKERAENLMIVDLMRNDLARVCAPGSVAVERFLGLETHAHVHQLVSSVSGELRDGCDVFDAIESCFPGGSMTGAPKRRAVEILARLEKAPRGLYSGCFGWVDRGGGAELAMTIRGAELRGCSTGVGARALVGAGGGITIDSDPAAELRERDHKARALRSALVPAAFPAVAPTGAAPPGTVPERYP